MKELVGMDIFVSELLQKYKLENITSKNVLDNLDTYNTFLVVKLNIEQFIGKKQIFFGFDFTKSGDKIIFLTKNNGKQHMFTYDESTKKFLGKNIINDLINIGLKYK